MEPSEADSIERQPDGTVGVEGSALTTPAGEAFGSMLVTVCPVAASNALASTVVPSAVRALRGGLPLADLGVQALSEAGHAGALELAAAWSEIQRLDDEAARRRAEAEAEANRSRLAGRGGVGR